MREIRRGRPEDAEALAGIFHRGVQEGAAPRYTAEQRRAWLAERPATPAFAARLAPQEVFVAEEDGRPTGFMTLDRDGHLDLAFVLPEARGTGLADALLAVLENHARATGRRMLTVRASAMAEPFLARHGWIATGPVAITRGGVTLTAADMVRDLTSDAPAGMLRAAE